MRARFLLRVKVNRWPLVTVALLVVGLGGLVAGCGGKGATTTAGKPSTTTATAETTTTTQAAREIQVFKDIRFMTERRRTDHRCSTCTPRSRRAPGRWW